MENEQTYNVDWIKDLPVQPTEDDSIVLVIVTKKGERVRLRFTVFRHYKAMRAANGISESVSDRGFLTDGLQDLINRGGGTHFEIGIAKMREANPNGRRVQFKGDAFGKQGTTRAD